MNVSSSPNYSPNGDYGGQQQGVSHYQQYDPAVGRVNNATMVPSYQQPQRSFQPTVPTGSNHPSFDSVQFRLTPGQYHPHERGYHVDMNPNPPLPYDGRTYNAGGSMPHGLYFASPPDDAIPYPTSNGTVPGRGTQPGRMQAGPSGAQTLINQPPRAPSSIGRERGPDENTIGRRRVKPAQHYCMVEGCKSTQKELGFTSISSYNSLSQSLATPVLPD
ncbi:hypothetical protein CYLTODRAFT_417743 [Cylindrobasidium torrendii FP15055 ss-10]|uniref:Uncharacterized protein n=1 Tax=Cylindrobasidium torrendii FP15055 ss-10 TaxID=1314674 RepID=A0A0D7BQV1_9AGAR|nr:hypothetical protein CYLTODRAFT_417743 [Cylindrobasidium torrendii FP15055 ss-10]